MNRRFCFTVAVVFALLAWAIPANATHVTCGSVITSNESLDSDISCPADYNSAALFVTASNVRVWMNGHSITATTPTGIGISVQGSEPLTNVHIQNGTISGFATPVIVNNASNSSVGKLTVNPPPHADGIQIIGDRNYVYSNVVTNAAGPSSARSGIYMRGAEAHAWGNTLRGWAAGISMSAATGSGRRSTRSKAATRSSVGRSGSRSSATHCRRATMQACPVPLPRTTLCGDRSTRTAGLARLASPQVLRTRRKAAPALFRRNNVTGTLVGMSISDVTAIIGRNTTNNNSDTGIRSSTSGTRIQNNTANDNGNYGIQAANGTVDGGGNTATGNGTQNCVNVSCP